MAEKTIEIKNSKARNKLQSHLIVGGTGILLGLAANKISKQNRPISFILGGVAVAYAVAAYTDMKKSI